MTSNIDPRHGDGRETSPPLRSAKKTRASQAQHARNTRNPPSTAPTTPPSRSEGGRERSEGGRERSEQGDARNSPHKHPITFVPRHSRKPSVIPASHPSFPQVIRHSRGRGNPEKNKAHHFHPQHQTTPPPKNPLPQQPSHHSAQSPKQPTTCPLTREPFPSPSRGGD